MKYRTYDLTGSHVTHDIEAPTLADAIEAGREWIEGGDWASQDGTIRIGVDLPACVREVTTRPASPLDVVYSLEWDLWSPEWDGSRWSVDVSDIDASARPAVADALGRATGGTWELIDDRCVWVSVPSDWETEDITREQDAADCSGSYSDDEPACTSDGPGDDDGGHDWRSPHSLLGGLKENPGVWGGSGTRMSVKTVCAACGKYRTETSAGSQRNHGEPDAVVTYEDADEASEAWLVRVHEEDGWIPQWLAEQLGRAPTTRHTAETAREYVAEHMDDEGDDDELEHVFAALHGVRADDADRAEGLWARCVSAS